MTVYKTKPKQKKTKIETTFSNFNTHCAVFSPTDDYIWSGNNAGWRARFRAYAGVGTATPTPGDGFTIVLASGFGDEMMGKRVLLLSSEPDERELVERECACRLWVGRMLLLERVRLSLNDRWCSATAPRARTLRAFTPLALLQKIKLCQVFVSLAVVF